MRNSYKLRLRRSHLNQIIQFLLFLLLGWLLLTSPVLAQSKPATPIEVPTPLASQGQLNFDASGISSEKINQFVHAYLQVVDLIDRREGELQSSETETESLRIEHDIEAEAFALIEQAGLNRQDYLQLLGLANTDPEFGERIAAQLQETANF